MSQMRSYVYAVSPSIDMSKCPDEDRFWLPRVMIGDVRYFNCMSLVKVVLPTLDSKFKLERVFHSPDNGPWIDEIPVEFRDAVGSIELKAAEKLAARWHEKCDWGHYGHWVAPWENLVVLIILQIGTIAKFAVAHKFKMYYSQDTRHAW